MNKFKQQVILTCLGDDNAWYCSWILLPMLGYLLYIYIYIYQLRDMAVGLFKISKF